MSFGTDGGGNIDVDPCFVDTNNIDGDDNIYGTADDGLRLDVNSLCIDAANGDEALDDDMLGYGRVDVNSVGNTGTGIPDYTDIGAYEYYTPYMINQDGFPYITSFEEYQGFTESNSVNDVNIWSVEDGNAIITQASFTEGSDEFSYNYVAVDGNNTTLSRNFAVANQTNNTYLRISCIPTDNMYIKILDKNDLVAALRFGDPNNSNDPNIYVFDGSDYASMDFDYKTAAQTARDYMEDPTLHGFSYENSWMEFAFIFDWQNDIYDVNCQGSVFEADFSKPFSRFTQIRFETAADDPNKFYLNRISVSEQSQQGGVVGDGGDVWITSPDADWEVPLEGHVPLYGSVWYDQLSRYDIKACQADLSAFDPNNWMLVYRGNNIVNNGVIGYFDTYRYTNGSYLLKIEVYNDVNQIVDSGLITKTITYNGSDKSVYAQYPIIGRAKAHSFNYEMTAPDISINWPGTFPLEFKRSYHHSMRNYLLPLWFGWTHNNSIHIMESTETDWLVDSNGLPAADNNDLGIGRLYLMMPVGGRAFDCEQVTDANVIYKPLDDEPDYIVRTSSIDGNTFDVNYIHYGPDGMIMQFGKLNNNLTYTPSGEGAVAWSVYIGVDQKEDRFGNALIYNWDSNEIYLDSISNNRTLAQLKFAYAPPGSFPSWPDVLEYISISDGANSNKVVEFDISNLGTIYHFRRKGDSSTNYDSGLRVGNDPDHLRELLLIDYPYWNGTIIDNEWFGIVVVSHNEDGSLDWVHYYGQGTIGISHEYSYQYDQGNLITHEKRRNDVGTAFPNTFQEIVTESAPSGVVLNQKIHNTTIETLEPPSNIFSLQYDEYIGGGGYTDTEYKYQDSRFPNKPTSILEYFDDDGDGNYDGDPRKTTMSYDSRGNLIEQRTYIDSTNYVLIQYDYHPIYSLPVRRTTWSEYADSGQTPTSGKIEQQWIYGDANGSEDPNGKYLVAEKTLLNEQDDVNAVTKYTYKQNGAIVTKTDPENRITYFDYDSNGFLSAVWEGAVLDGNGDPQGDPQKRFVYDELGDLKLQGNKDGLVKRHYYDYDDYNNYFARRRETRTYLDSTAMSRSDFDITTYDSNYVRTTKFEHYDIYGNCVLQELATGGQIAKDYHFDGKKLHMLNDEFDGDIIGDISWWIDPQGNVIKYDVRDGVFWSSSDSWNCYDSMLRCVGELISEGRFLWNGRNNYDVPGVFKRYGYSATGAKTSEEIYGVSGGVVSGFEMDPQPSKYTLFDYDNLDRMIEKIEDPNGANEQIVDYGYDAAGNRTYLVDPNGNVIFTDYDNANRRTYEYFACEPVLDANDTNYIDITSTKENAVVRKAVEYYLDGKIKSVTSYDNDGNTPLEYCQYTYDSRGRIYTVIRQIDDSNDASTQYDYNDIGFSVPNDPCYYDIRITDAENQLTYICLNEDRKLHKVLYPSGDYEEIFYDGNGIAVGKTVWRDSNSYTLEYECDEFGRRTKIIYPLNGGNIEFEYASYAFELAGRARRPIKIIDNRVDQPYGAGAVYEMSWDVATGNLIVYSDPCGYTTQYEYNPAYQTSKEWIQVFDPYENVVYDANYTYNLLGGLEDLKDGVFDISIADFDYDEKGNRTQLKYWLTGQVNGPNTVIDYTYDIDNRLIGITADANADSSGDPNYVFDANSPNDIDGLGRLWLANETITVPGQGNRQWAHQYTYDMQSQLTSAVMDRDDTQPTDWSFDYRYLFDGNISQKTLNAQDTDYEYDTTTGGSLYDSDIMTAAGSNSLTWDENGRLVTGLGGLKFYYNWDGKLKDVNDANDDPLIRIQYDPFGNRIYKWSSDPNTPQGGTKYIVDVSGKLPTILCEIKDANDPNGGSIKNQYYYTNGQVLTQYDCNGLDESNDLIVNGKYFYINDRLGSVRQVIDTDGTVVNSYTYDPFGQDISAADCNVSVYNPFKFTGQWYDSEIGQYYLRARMYDPVLMRLTSNDPVRGKFQQPLTLHRYLYCGSDPVNRIDPSGKTAYSLLSPILTGSVLYAQTLNLANYAVSSGDLRFFDLAEMTGHFLPIAMSMATASSFTPLWAQMAGTVASLATDVTSKGMGASGLLVDGWTNMLYSSLLGRTANELGMDNSDIDNFLEWKGGFLSEVYNVGTAWSGLLDSYKELYE